MNRQLRQYHFFAWRLLALGLPVAFAAAFILRPPSLGVEPGGMDIFRTEYKALSDSTSIITITVNKPLTVPSCVIFHVTDEAETLLGKLDHQGTYEFVINSAEKDVTLKLVDAIHQNVITSITLNEMKNSQTTP